jgi:integrase
VPERGRWWDQAVERYAEFKRESGEWTGVSRTSAGGDLRVWPSRFEAAGFPRPLHAREITAEMVTVWKENPVGPMGPLRGTSAGGMLGNLRAFLRWAGNRIADKKGLWRMAERTAYRRRWYDRATIDKLFAEAPDRLKPMLALMAWAGLRRRGAWGVRVSDVNLALDRPTVRATMKGGAEIVLPLPKAALNALRPAVVGKNSDERLYPLGYVTLGKDIERLGKRLGIRLSAHDLRRSFGRILHNDFGVDLNTIRCLYHHKSADMTAHYIGADTDRMARALGHFDKPVAPVELVSLPEVS